MNHDVFISYSKKDAKRIKPLRDALTVAGIKYWIDDRIDGSENFLAEIPDAIKKCSIVLFVASQNSANSEWTQKELVYARKLKKEIFPYKLDDFQFENCPELDFFFTNIQWKENVGDVVAGLEKKLGIIEARTLEKPISMKKTLEVPSISPITGALVIKTDLDCRVFNYGEEIGIAKAGEYTKFELPLGDNELKYVGLECDEDCYEEQIIINENRRISVEVALLDKYNVRKAKEEAERQRVEVERIEKVKAEREDRLLKLPDGAFVRFEENGKYGFKLKSTGEIVVPCKYYDDAGVFSDGLAAVKFYGKWGFIDKTGKKVVNCKYDIVKPFFNGFALVGGWYCGFIDKTGKEITPIIYDAAYPFFEGLAAVCLNDKWGFIDNTGKEVISKKYYEVKSFINGKALVKTKNIFGVVKEFYIDKNGNRIEE